MGAKKATTAATEQTKTAEQQPAEDHQPVHDDAPAGNAELPPIAPPPKPWYRQPLAWVVAAVVLVVGGGASVYALHKHDKSHPKPTSSTSLTTTHAGQSSQTSTTSAPPATASPSVGLDVSFFTSPKPLNTDLHFFKDPESFFGTSCTGPNASDCTPNATASDFAYYQIGTTAKNQPVVAGDNSLSNPINGSAYFAIEDTAGHYQLLTKPSGLTPQAVQDFTTALSANVVLNTTDTFSAFAFPTQTSPGGLAVSLGNTSDADASGYLMQRGLRDIRPQIFNNEGTAAPPATKLTTSQGKDYYEVTAEDQTNFKVVEIYGTINAVYAASYRLDNGLVSRNDKPITVSWKSGANNLSEYFSAGQGCGSAYGFVVAKGLDAASLTAIGTANSATLYALPTSATLFGELYQDYQSNQAGLQDKSLSGLTQQQFLDSHAVFVAKDALGEWVVYQRGDMFTTGGCGKPVVYLYPQQPTSVSVQVGADVRKSAPLYVPDTGWQNVFAMPSGQLFYNGQSYDSLYWEGFGHGAYPDITSGTVVPRAQVASTIRAQLAQQGLNTKEINDFMAFWQPKLPTTPYIRLTWLTLAQINELAPLTVTPQPQTVIRVFLDFAGLNQPEALPAQQLRAPQRQGFTLVEWGGLLRDGSLQR